MLISDLYTEFMKQTFNDSKGVNYTPYVFMLYLKEKRYELINETIKDLCIYTFRFYIDNLQLAKQNSSVIISNIENNFPKDLKPYIIEQLNIWMKNGNGVLLTDGNFLMLNQKFPLLSKQDLFLLDKVIDSISLKHFKTILSYSCQIEKVINNIDFLKCSYEDYKNEINKTRFINRAYEYLNYCACCEECDKKLLQPIHLNFFEGLDDPTNSIVLCDKHAKMYFENKFRFSKSGKIIIYNQDCDLDKRMHLNVNLTKIKNYYLLEK